MESKSYQKFRSKIEYIHQHLQLLDASIKSLSTTLTKENDKSLHITTVLSLSPNTHPKLKHPVKEKDRILSYSRSKMAEYTILELFGAFSIYMRDLTDEMYKKDPMKIVGKVAANSSLTYAEIMNLGSMDSIGTKMVNEIFRKLENERSTIKLIDKVLSHTKVKISDSKKVLALMYLEMRHLFVHSKGKADAKFKNKYSKHLTLKANDKLPTNFKTVSSAIDAVNIFAKEIDKQLISEGMIESIQLPHKSDSKK